MTLRRFARVALIAASFATGLSSASQAGAASLTRGASIVLPDVQGRMDHFSIDPSGQRLFVAALGAGSVEVIDLTSSARSARIQGLREPQGVAWLGATRLLFVAEGAGSRLTSFAGTTASAVLDRLDDADNLRFDGTRNQLLVGYTSGLAAVDPESMRRVVTVPLAGHPEAFVIAASGATVYVNVPTARHVAVVDRAKGSVRATWPITDAEQNFAMAIDESSRRLFVATRKPALLLVMDADSGARVATVPICQDTDDLFYDAARHRIYAICGEGVVAVIRQQDAGHYDVIERTPTAPGARTGLFVAAQRTLYVAAPARSGTAAQILVLHAE